MPTPIMFETTSAVALTIPNCRSNEDAGFPVNSPLASFRAPAEQNITHSDVGAGDKHPEGA
jgi:hypothetical protein